MIQEIGKSYQKNNIILLVDSSGGEVDRPSLSDKGLSGISDPKDPLKFDALFLGGPEEYTNWFNDF